MSRNQPLRFMAVVEQPANSNYAESPRLRFTSGDLSSVPSKRSTRRSLERVQDHVTMYLKQYLPNKDSRFLIWLIDESGNPIFFITGLLDVRSGKLTKEQIAEREHHLLPQITCEQVLTDLEITVSAMAELTFTEGFDFEATDDDGDDDSIADELVEESCGHLETSYVSYVERDENYLLVNAEITETLAVEVPWNPSKRLRPDQMEYLKVLADDELHEQIAANRFANLTVELDEASVRTA